MRSTRRRRPRRRELNVPAGVDLEKLASRVAYVGSPEHKNHPGFAGPPRLREDATPCPPNITERDVVSDWLRDAIRRGAIGSPWEQEFPRYAWYMLGKTVFEGRLVNREAGVYKGYALQREEWPRGIEKVYAD